MLRFSILITVALMLSGCDQLTTKVDTQSGDSQSAEGTDASPGSSTSAGTTPSPSPSGPREVQLTVSTNAYGATVTLKSKQSGEEIATQVMPPGESSIALPVTTEQAYEVTASLAGLSAFAATDTIAGDTPVELKFSEPQLDDLRKAATCLLKIPGGGFGSGFLLGDRQTMATAAHCVACQNVEELEIVFHPTEPKEKTVKGAKLIYFDAEQDVALMHLAEPLEESRPYYWRTRDAEEGDKIEIVGNPGRGGRPDPMYARTATMKGGRTDEYFVDIELKPGYSGGPHSLAGGMDAVGITSFKIVGGNYEDLGKSFAKSVDIAADAFEHWQSLNSELQQSKLEREKSRYEERYGFFMANEAAFAMYIDGTVYLITCIQVVNDYNRHINLAISKLPNPTTRASLDKTTKLAHRDYIKTKGPEKAKETRERLSPKLMMAQNFDEMYNRALEDEFVTPEIKSDLKNAHEQYELLKEAAENIVDPSKTSKRGKTLREFIDYVLEIHKDLRYFAFTVKGATEGRLE